MVYNDICIMLIFRYTDIHQPINTSNISIDKAKEIALNHAGLAANQVSFVKAEKDMDDGIVKYDIEFYYNNREYNYEINANNAFVRTPSNIFKVNWLKIYQKVHMILLKSLEQHHPC